jgi:ribosomal protein L35
MAQVLSKEYNCLTCSAPIKLQRKNDNSGWIKYNLDGTKHIDVKKSTKQQQQQQGQQVVSVDNGQHIAALAEQVKDLKETVNVLISQIQMLLNDVKNKK